MAIKIYQNGAWTTTNGFAKYYTGNFTTNSDFYTHDLGGTVTLTITNNGSTTYKNYPTSTVSYSSISQTTISTATAPYNWMYDSRLSTYSRYIYSGRTYTCTGIGTHGATTNTTNTPTLSKTLSLGYYYSTSGSVTITSTINGRLVSSSPGTVTYTSTGYNLRIQADNNTAIGIDLGEDLAAGASKTIQVTLPTGCNHFQILSSDTTNKPFITFPIIGYVVDTRLNNTKTYTNGSWQ